MLPSKFIVNKTIKGLLLKTYFLKRCLLRKKINFMKITFLILFSALSFSSFAQNDKKQWQKMPTISTQSIGISFQKFEGLNQSIAAFPQYKGLRDYMGTLSLGSMMVKKNFITGITATGGSSMSGDRDKKSSALRFLGAQLNFGYDVIRSEKFMLYPLVGIGFEGYQARFNKDNSSVNFNDVLNSSTTQNNIRPVKFTNSFATYNLGFGFTVKAPKCNNSIGFQAGYSGSFKDRAWKSSNMQSLANAPVDNLGRFQVGLVFSGMSHSMK